MKIVTFYFSLLIVLFICNQQIAAQNSTEVDSLQQLLQNAKSDTQRVEIMLDLGETYRIMGSEKAGVYAADALKLAKKISYVKGEALAYQYMGIQSFFAGHIDKSLEEFQKSLPLFIDIKDSIYISVTYKKIATALAYQDNFKEGIEYFHKALVIDSLRGNLLGVSDNYNNIGVLLNYMGDHELSMQYQKKSLAVCRQLNDKKSISIRLVNLGVSYDDQSRYDSAIACYTEALALKREINDMVGTSSCLNNLGEVYNDLGNYGKAIEYYEQSLNIDKELNDKRSIAISLLNIGDIHAKQKNYDKALEYFNNSMVFADSVNDKRIMANNLNHTGELLIKRNKIIEAQNKFELAIQYSTENGDQSELAKSYSSLGQIHLENRQFRLAIRDFQGALDLHQELGESAKMANDQIKIGEAWYQLDAVENAISWFQKGLEQAREVGAKEQIRMAAENLSNAYSKKQDYKNAFENHVLFKQMHDSIFTLESKKQISNVENRFELERKEQKIEIQNIKLLKQAAEIRQQDNRQKALIGLVGAIFIIAILIVVGYLRIKKANTIISTQMQQIEETNEELKQINEELRVTLETNNQQKKQLEKKNKEITDSIHYANQIQQALLPRKAVLKKLFPEHFIFYKPQNIIGGDFYWVAEVDSKIVLAVADCTGHGVPGALMSMLGISFLSEIVNKMSITQPDHVLNRLRSDIIAALHQEGKIGEHREGLDIALCTIDKANQKLQFAGAKMPLYIVRSSGEPAVSAGGLNSKEQVLYEIKGDKMPIAQYEKMSDFKCNEVAMIPGDKLYLFSDGFADQFGGEDKKRFQYKPFKEMLVKMAGEPMDNQHQTFEKTFSEWRDKLEQMDDVLVLGIKLDR